MNGDADLAFLNGDVVTLDAEQTTASALAARAGRIIAIGCDDEVRALCGRGTEVVDLAGRALLPGFIDAHGHVTNVAQALNRANLAPPPAGPVETLADLVRELRDHLAQQRTPPGEWLTGRGYDESMLAEGRAPTRDDLDAVSTEHPILLTHASGHLFAVNSRGLELADIGPDTPDPAGGVIRRRPNSREPDGVLEETAGFALAAAVPQEDEPRRLDLLDAAQKQYLAAGYTTAQDGATGPAAWDLLEAAAAAGRLSVDVVAYPVFAARHRARASGFSSDAYKDRLKFGGVKLFLDGSPQGKTAWLSAPYEVPPAGQAKDYRGYPQMSDEDLATVLDKVLAEEFQVIVHTNGDQAAEQLVTQVEAASQRTGKQFRRPVMIHAQTVRDDQLDRMRSIPITPSFFVSHTFFWGDWHRDSVLGPERASRISPVRSAIEREMRFTLHNDAPVTPPSALQLVWSAVNRLTRSGRVLGEGQRVDVLDALRGVTSHAAWQYFEEDEKGTLEVGKVADLVLLGENPLKVPPEALLDIEVVGTWKDGVA